MCTLKELSDGTYDLYDIEVMHQIIDIKIHQSQPVELPPQMPTH